MIEEVSAPADLRTWDGQVSPFYYLEVFGETRPLLNTQYAEVLAAGPIDGTAQTTQAAPIYEYWWTIGHPGHNPFQSKVWSEDTMSAGESSSDRWQSLQEVEGAAARVYLYFPVANNWRIKELMATLKYLTPVPQQGSWWNTIANDWSHISPLVDDASKLAGLVPGGAGAAPILSTIAKLQINTVPQTKTLDWSVEKVTFGRQPRGVMQGIMWQLPKAVFLELGSRITGGVALSFIPCHVQEPNHAAEEVVAPVPGKLLAHSVIYGPKPNGPLWSPGPDGRKFIELWLEPQLPSESTSTSEGTTTQLSAPAAGPEATASDEKD